MPGSITYNIAREGKVMRDRYGVTVSPGEKRADPLLSDLLARVRENDSQAFENLIAYTQERAFRLAYNIIGDYHQAQDVLQEAYIRVFRYNHTLKSPQSFNSWLAKIIVNLSKEFLSSRKEQAEWIGSIDDTPSEAPYNPGIIEKTEGKERLREAFGRLSSSERTTMLLREFYELKYEEVSKILKIPIGTVKSRLNEARRKLADFVRGREEQGNGMQ